MFRTKIAMMLVQLGIRLMPEQHRQIFNTLIDLPTNFQKQVENGREGGIAIVPWFTSENGKKLAELQREEAGFAADAIRRNFER